MNDYRSEALKRFHTDVGKSQTWIDLWNEGYEFFETHFPAEGPSTPIRLAMQYAKFSVIDMSHEAEAYWMGYEAATVAAYESGRRTLFEDEATQDDVAWALSELGRWLRGDRK